MASSLGRSRLVQRRSARICRFLPRLSSQPSTMQKRRPQEMPADFSAPASASPTHVLTGPARRSSFSRDSVAFLSSSRPDPDRPCDPGVPKHHGARHHITRICGRPLEPAPDAEDKKRQCPCTNPGRLRKYLELAITDRRTGIVLREPSRLAALPCLRDCDSSQHHKSQQRTPV